MKKEKAEQSDINALIGIGIPQKYAEKAFRLSYNRGEYMIMEGYPVPFLMLIISGLAKVSCTVPSGRKLLLSFYKPGEILGIVELPLGIDAASEVEASEPTVCAALSLNLCRSIMNQSPQFATTLCRNLAAIVNQSSKAAALNLLSSLRQRLCAYIISTENDGLFQTNYTHLAEMLGTSGRHLFREMARLCSDGILAKEGHAYRISDQARLGEEAQ
ncbi:MAG: cyclic nucleotide-binding domain-containing protein [Sphaerochaetaceae bacterium]